MLSSRLAPCLTIAWVLGLITVGTNPEWTSYPPESAVRDAGGELVLKLKLRSRLRARPNGGSRNPPTSHGVPAPL